MRQRATRYDTRPLVRLIKISVKENGGIKMLENRTEMKEATYYGRNKEPDKYHLGEIRALMLAYGIPKEDILAAIDKALTG